MQGIYIYTSSFKLITDHQMAVSAVLTLFRNGVDR